MQYNKSLTFNDEIYSWDDFDKDANVMGLDRSKFLVFLYKFWKKKNDKYFDQFRIIVIILMFGFAFMTILMIYIVMMVI